MHYNCQEIFLNSPMLVVLYLTIIIVTRYLTYCHQPCWSVEPIGWCSKTLFAITAYKSKIKNFQETCRPGQPVRKIFQTPLDNGG